MKPSHKSVSRHIALALSALLVLNPVTAMAEETTNDQSQKPATAESANDQDTDSTDASESTVTSKSQQMQKQFNQMMEEFNKQNADMIGNHESLTEGFDADMSISDMFTSFQDMKAEFDKQVNEYGQIDLFDDDEEGKDIKDSLDDQDASKEIDDDIANEYNASGWITADKKSKSTKERNLYNTQKSSDDDYNAYNKKFKSALKSFKKKTTKEDVEETASDYPKMIDQYQDNINSKLSDSKSTLTAPKLSGAALANAEKTSSSFSKSSSSSSNSDSKKSSSTKDKDVFN